MPPPAIRLEIAFQAAPGSLSSLSSQVQRELQSAVRGVDFGVSPQAASNVAQVNRQLTVAQGNLRSVQAASAQAAASMRVFGSATLETSGFMDNLATQAGLAARRFLA